MLYSAGLGLRNRRLKFYRLDGDFKSTMKQSDYDASLGGAFESNSKSAYFVGLGVEAHNTCNVLLGRAFENTIVPHLFSLQNFPKE